MLPWVLVLVLVLGVVHCGLAGHHDDDAGRCPRARATLGSATVRTTTYDRARRRKLCQRRRACSTLPPRNDGKDDIYLRC